MKAVVEDNGVYRCIECGHECAELYHNYCDGVVKLMHCVTTFFISGYWLIILIIINRHFRNAQLTMNCHKGARGDTEPGLTLIQVHFQ